MKVRALVVDTAAVFVATLLCLSTLSCAKRGYIQMETAAVRQEVQIQAEKNQAQLAELQAIAVRTNERAAAAANQAAEAEARARAAEEKANQMQQELNLLRRAVATPPPPPQTSALPDGIKGYREVFFATDRKPTSDGTYGSSPSDNGGTTYGRALVSIPQIHQPGELEQPWQVFSISFPEDSKRHITIAYRQSVPVDVFFTNIRDSIEASPDKSAFVFVHGYNVSFDEAVLRTGQLAWDLKFRGPAVAYSWPSADRAVGYIGDIEMADWTAPHLEAFLRELRRSTGAKTIHLIGHSMGGRVLTKALERVANVQPTARPPHFQELVLAAPDINAQVFRQLASALQRTTDRVTIYCSRRDLALRLSATLRHETARTGGNSGVLAAFPGFDVIDATRISTSLVGHSYFAESVQMLNDLALLLKQRLGPDQRSVSMEAAGSVWVFRAR